MFAGSKENYFAKTAYMRLFIPSLIAAVGMSLVIIVDSITVGSTLGAQGLASLSIANILLVFLDFINYSFSIGGSIRYAKEVGSGNVKQGMTIFNSTFFGALILSVVLSLIGLICISYFTEIFAGTTSDPVVLEGFKSYARNLFLFLPPYILKYVLYDFVNIDSPKYASTVLLVGNIISFALSVLLVMACGLGIGGAALATGIASTITAILLILNPLSSQTIISFQPRLAQCKIAFRAFGDGVSSSYMHLLDALVYSFSFLIIERIGGTTGLAIFNVITTLLLLLRAISDSVNHALSPLISTFWSEKSYHECKYSLKNGVISGVIGTFLLGMILSLFSYNVTTCLGLSGEVVPLCQMAIFFVSLSSLPMAVNQILAMYYQIINKKKFTIMITVLQGAIFPIPFVYLCSYLGIRYVWLYYFASEAATLIFLLLFALCKKTITFLPSYVPQRVFSFTMSSEDNDFSELLPRIAEAINNLNLSKRQSYFLNLVVEEICTDIIQNVFSSINKEEQYLKLTLMRDTIQDFTIFVRDNAIHYNPFDPSPKKDVAHDLSITLIKNNADYFFYRRYQGFNSLILTIKGDPNIKKSIVDSRTEIE